MNLTDILQVKLLWEQIIEFMKKHEISLKANFTVTDTDLLLWKYIFYL